ncbi:MAG: antitoxin VapB family protein [Candidatus Marsarchaeota archaeon]|nr:antitoxin VapB family protein [Candidatus Marsarchaeota archaeon]
MKTIMLSDEAYKKLASIKGSKSFTKLVLELVDKVKGVKLADLDKFFGIIRSDEARSLQMHAAKIRRRFKVRV